MIRRRYLKFPVETFKSIQLWVTITALTLAPLFFGSVDQLWVATWTILLAISTLCGLAAPMRIMQTRVMTGFLAVCFAYGLVAILQVVPHLIDQLDDPIWQRANDLLGFNTLPRISSRAEIPPVAIGHFLLLVTSFMSGFFVGTSHRNADLLIWFARYSILSYAAYGLVALLLTGSRGGLICSSLGLLAAIGLMIANKLRPRLWSILGWAGLALVVVAVWLSGAGRIGSHGLFDDGRWTVYGFCIEAIGQRPLLGAGAGTFADLFPSLRAADLSSWGVWDYAHSTILEMAVEMGIPIAAMVVIAAAASLFILVRAALRSKDRSQTSLAAITGIAVLSYLHSIIDFSLQIPGYLIVFGILLGCGLARASSEQTTVQRARSGTSNFREINRSSERPVSLT